MKQSTSSPLCVIVRNSDGEQIKCRVLDWPIYNPNQLMPDMHVTGRVNVAKEAIITQRGDFFTQKRQS